jgi:hypothetical protein
MKVFEILDETEIPEELLSAVKWYGEGKYKIQTKTCIGWVDVESPEFRCGCEYRIAEAYVHE